MYCIHCGKESKLLEGTCENCGQELVNRDLEAEEIKSLNRGLHTRENKSRENADNDLVFIVLGSTLLIVGFLFLLLSFKLPNVAAQKKVLTFTCFEFWVSMAGLGVGGVLFLLGLVKFIIEKYFIQKEITRALDAVQTGNYHHMQLHSLESSENKENLYGN